MNGYHVVSAGEDTFIKCEKKIQAGIILITEQPDEQASLEKTVLDAQQVTDAYALETNAGKVYVYFPVAKLNTKDLEHAQMVKQYQYQGETCYDNLLCGVTDDGKYIHGIVYTRDETEIKISVFVDGK